MITLNRFLVNPFDDRNISLDELVAFATDHLQRMIANNPGGVFDARIAATQAALTVLGQGTTNDLIKLGLRKAGKLVKRQFRASLSGRLIRIYGTVVGALGGRHAGVVECFPLGRRIFTRCPDDLLAGHLRHLRDALAERQADLGTAVADEAESMLGTWTVLHEASEASTGEKVATEEGRRQARAAVQRELFRNLLTLALHLTEEPENNEPDRLSLYMQPHWLRDRKRRKPEAVGGGPK